MAEPTSEEVLLDPKALEQLIGLLQSSDVDELELAHGSSRLYLRRESVERAPAEVAEHAPPALADVSIRAPLPGVFYSRPSPDQPPFLSPGDIVVPGQVVALIETMKLFNEVVSDVEGEVVEMPLPDGELVREGQDLIYLKHLQRAEGS